MVTLPGVGTGPFVVSFFVLAYALARQMEHAVSQRLAQGVSPEQILTEWAESAKGTPEGKGLGHLLSALLALRQNRPAKALEELRRLKERSPDLAPFVHPLEGAVLTLLRDYENAFNAYKRAFLEMHKPLRRMKSFYPKAREMEREIYRQWALTGIAQGLEGLLSGNAEVLAAGLRKVHTVLTEARDGGQGEAVWEAIDRVTRSMDREHQPQVDLFRTAVRIIADERAGPGWIEELARSYTSTAPVRGAPAGELEEKLRDIWRPDPEFAEALEAIHKAQPTVGEPRWPG